MKTEQELKDIARGILQNEIFTDRQLHNATELPSVFMPLMFLTAEKAQEMFGPDPAGMMIYEYMHKAMPLGVNGLPVFGSFNVLKKEESARVCEFYEEMKKAIA